MSRDGRAVRDVAADGAGRAHLLRPEAAQHLPDVGVEGAERRLGLRVGCRGADHHPILLLAYLVQGGDAPGVDDAGKLAELLGDPEADVGGAGDDRRVRMAGRERGEPIFGGGGGEERVFVSREEVVRVAAVVPVLGESGEPAGGLGRTLRVRIVRLAGAAGEGRVRDRAIAGAAAEVSRRASRSRWRGPPALPRGRG